MASAEQLGLCTHCGAPRGTSHGLLCPMPAIQLREMQQAEEALREIQKSVVASALDTQVGGDHYKTMPLQPWEIIDRNNLDFWQGNAIKYIMRYRDKGGVEDLKKAIHYIEYLIERYQKQQVSK